MRQLIPTALLALSLSPFAMAGPSPLYYNPGLVTQPPTVDAVVFENSGIFDAFTAVTFSNLTTSANLISTPLPFATRDTVYFTNTGTMVGIPGFRFDTATATTRFNALDVFNHGTIIGEDTPAVPISFATTGSMATTAIPQDSQPYPSQILIYSTNVYNDGEIGVGNGGILKIVAENFTNAHGALAAGGVSTGGASSLFLGGTGLVTQSDPLDTTGRGSTTLGYFVNPPGVYDVLWGSTNGGMLRVDQLAGLLPSVPPINEGIRGLGVGAGLGTLNLGTPLSEYASYVYTFNSDPTNVYYEIVLVNTNFADTNISASVVFSQNLFNGIPQANFGDAIPPVAVIQYAVSTTDVLTGDTVTNAIYLIDSGAKLTNVVLLDNASTANNYDRPMCFEVTTATPLEWEGGISVPQSPFNPGVIYTPGSFVNNSVPFIAGEYAAQIGRNPETLDGTFSASLTGTVNGTNLTILANELIFGSGVVLPDPTNEPGRIDITAGQADLTSARIRAEGIVMLNITNLIGAGTAAEDWGITDASIGYTNGPLVLANVFPTNFQRVRGILNAWSGTWQNVFTNALTTNNYHMHVLVVDQVLRGNFTPSIRNLTFNSTGSLNVQNDLTVINQAFFDTTNLVLNANVRLSQGAANLYPANIPNLNSMVVNPNASLTVDGVLDMGYDLTQGPTSPVGRAYSILDIANFGSITAIAPFFQSEFFTNDGVLFADTNGSMAINASQLTLGSLGEAATNFLVAGGSISLSADSIEATNSEIVAGTLNLDATSSLSDDFTGVPSPTPATVNYWQVSDGFNMPVKPAKGELLATEIRTTVSGFGVSSHVWAGTDDPEDPVAGFENNVVIGHLVLDRLTSSSILSFSGAGPHNAMYVNYLELADFSYSDYRHGLLIDTNTIKIYFANANADPNKLMQVYPNGLIWVSNALGFNGSASVGTPPDGMGGGHPKLTVSVYGVGTVRPDLTSVQPATGSANTLTATPGKGWIFDNWTTSGLAAGADTNSPVLNFTFSSDTAIAANFIRAPFGSSQRVYNGLFYDPASVTADNSGFFTLTLNPSGVFSGRLLLGPASYNFSSQFYGSGARQVQAASGKRSVTVNLQLDMSGATGRLTGDVNGGKWDSPLSADLAPVWSLRSPSPLAGNYTLVLPGGSGIGDSFGVANVSKLGVVSVAGSLADGTGFSQSAPVAEGEWPFYTYVASGKNTVLGWVEVGATGPAAANVIWIKAPNTGPYYSAGFENAFQLIGSRYVAPPKNLPALSLSDPAVTLTGGNLSEGITSPVTLQQNMSYASSVVTLSVTNSTGVVNGKFGQGQTISGVVLQNQNSARGFFLGTNESGAALLQGK